MWAKNGINIETDGDFNIHSKGAMNNKSEKDFTIKSKKIHLNPKK